MKIFEFLRHALLPVLLFVPTCLALYTNSWAAYIRGGVDHARAQVEEHGFIYHGEVLSDIHHITHSDVIESSIFPNQQLVENLSSHPDVEWLEQQQAEELEHNDIAYNDPYWPQMWNLDQKHGERLSMNVKEAWEMGYTGKNVVVTVVDTGIEHDHPDLISNYDPQASTDVIDDDSDPRQETYLQNTNNHGTRCAGIVAARADNGVCGVGVAPDAKVGGKATLLATLNIFHPQETTWWAKMPWNALNNS